MRALLLGVVVTTMACGNAAPGSSAPSADAGADGTATLADGSVAVGAGDGVGTPGTPPSVPGSGGVAESTCVPPGVARAFATPFDFATFVSERRWVRCASDSFTDADGFEFNVVSDAVTMLARDASGKLVPATNPLKTTVTASFASTGLANVFQMDLAFHSPGESHGSYPSYMTMITDSPRMLLLDTNDNLPIHGAFVPENDDGWPETEVIQPSIGAPLAPPAICAQRPGPSHPATTSDDIHTLLADDWIACSTVPGEKGFGHRSDVIGVRFDAGGTWSSLVHNGIGTIDVATDVPNAGSWEVSDAPMGGMFVVTGDSVVPEYVTFYDSPRTVVFTNSSSLVFIRRSDAGL